MIKKILIFILMILMLCSTAYADDELKTITKEYEFTSTTQDYDYKAPKTIKEESIEYILQNIEYEVAEQKPIYETVNETISKELTQRELLKESDADFERYVYVNEDGYIGTIKLQGVTFEEQTVTGRTASHIVYYNYDFQSEEPNPKDDIQTLYHDEETDCDVLVTLPFTELKKTSKGEWVNNINAECMHRSIYDDVYLLNDGTKLNYDTENPAYKDYETVLLKQFGLSPDTSRITGSRWIEAKTTEDGITTRLAGYTIERLTYKYTAVYSGSFDIPDMILYDATAYYEGTLSKQLVSGTEYTVKAIATYQEIPKQRKNTTAAVVAGTSSGVIALCGLIVFLKKKKNQK